MKTFSSKTLSIAALWHIPFLITAVPLGALEIMIEFIFLPFFQTLPLFLPQFQTMRIQSTHNPGALLSRSEISKYFSLDECYYHTFGCTLKEAFEFSSSFPVSLFSTGGSSFFSFLPSVFSSSDTSIFPDMWVKSPLSPSPETTVQTPQFLKPETQVPHFRKITQNNYINYI